MLEDPVYHEEIPVFPRIGLNTQLEHFESAEKKGSPVTLRTGTGLHARRICGYASLHRGGPVSQHGDESAEATLSKTRKVGEKPLRCGTNWFVEMVMLKRCRIMPFGNLGY